MGIHIIGAHDAPALNVIHFAQVGCHIEGHDIAGIIAVQVQHACARFHFFGNVVDLFRGGGLENAADTAAIDQTIPYIAQKQGEMSCSASRDDGYFPGLFAALQ